MDLINNSMIALLDGLYSILHNYGFAIIALTLIIRIGLWPLSKSQTLSMKKMQELQPKLKQLQDRYKAEPQKLQQEMMKLYQEHKFNPFGGCLPLLIQIPLFLGLYGAINSPMFMAGQDPIFLDFIHLKRAGVYSHAGLSEDGKLTLAENPEGGIFGIGKDTLVLASDQLTIKLKNGDEKQVKVPNIHEAVTFPTKLISGLPLKFESSYKQLGLEGYEGNIVQAKIRLKNTATTELEDLTFNPKEKETTFKTEIPTVAGKFSIHYDVIVLLIVFLVGMYGMQKQMSAQAAANANPQQQQMMKMMQLVFVFFLIMFPLPAGVLLYMAVNSVFQIVQTWWFNKEADKASLNKPAEATLDVSAKTS